MDWIYAEIDKTQIRKISKDILDEEIKEEGYKMAKNPHICLIPHFNSTIPVNLPKFEGYYNIEISGFEYYPNVETPMIIKLDVSDDSLVQLWRDELVDQIGKKSIHEEMKKPTIDLVVAGKIGQENQFEMNQSVRDHLIDQCESYDLRSHIRLKNVVRESKDLIQ